MEASVVATEVIYISSLLTRNAGVGAHFGGTSMREVLHNDTVFYILMALLVALPLFLLVAALLGRGLPEASTKTLQFLDDWAGIAPKAIRGYITKGLGFFGGFMFLMMLAYLLNSVALIAMPSLSSTVGHFGDPITSWQVENFPSWKNFEGSYKVQATREDENFDWWEKKASLDRHAVRACRIGGMAAFLLIVAGGADLVRRKYRSRGWATMVTGAVLLVMFVAMWSYKTTAYIGKLRGANQLLQEPVAFPEELERLMTGSTTGSS